MMKNRKMVKGIALGAMIAKHWRLEELRHILQILKQLPTVLQWVK